MIEIYEELEKFDHIKYNDGPHIYHINGKQTISVTGLIGKFHEEFEEDKWAEYKAVERVLGEDYFKSLKKKVGFEKVVDEYKKTGGSEKSLNEAKKVILKEWKAKNHHATYEGSTLHNFIENYLSNKIFPYPEENKEKTFTWPEIEKTYKVMEGHFLKFYSDIKGKLLPIKSEFIVGDEDYMLCGMVDQIFYNKKKKEFQIWDWKTNTKLKMENGFQKLIGPLAHLDDCEYTKYSLQLGIYKHIIEKNTNLKFGDSYITWFNENNKSYEVIECLRLEKEIKDMLDYKMKHPELFPVKELAEFEINF